MSSNLSISCHLGQDIHRIQSNTQSAVVHSSILFNSVLIVSVRHMLMLGAAPPFGSKMTRINQNFGTIYTLYDRFFDKNIPAKNAVYTLYMYGSGQP